VRELDEEDVEDLEEAPDEELQVVEEQILDQATAARTIAELRAEIETLRHLEGLALGVRRSGADTKWRELASLLGEIFTYGSVAVGPLKEGGQHTSVETTSVVSSPTRWRKTQSRAHRHQERVSDEDSSDAGGRTDARSILASGRVQACAFVACVSLARVRKGEDAGESIHQTRLSHLGQQLHFAQMGTDPFARD